MKAFLYRLSKGLKQVDYWVTGQFALLALRLLRLLPPDMALNFADRAARRVGPWFGRHGVAVANLKKAYPEKTETEIQAIASDMWGNMGRLGAEYIFLDAIFDYNPADAVHDGRIEVSGEEIFLRIAAEDAKPHIVFTAHLGNFELLPIAGAAFGLSITALFRPPNNPYIANYILSTRRTSMGELLASRVGASFALARILDGGGNIGVLVDQKFSNGLRTHFFGRPCETSPLLPKLVRQYECDVYPARCIRLPGNRFRLEIEDRLVLPRKPDGLVDVGATAQILNDVVERWVREDPGQWMWFHKRWDLGGAKHRRRKRAAVSISRG